MKIFSFLFLLPLIAMPETVEAGCKSNPSVDYVRYREAIANTCGKREQAIANVQFFGFS